MSITQIALVSIEYTSETAFSLALLLLRPTDTWMRGSTHCGREEARLTRADRRWEAVN